LIAANGFSIHGIASRRFICQTKSVGNLNFLKTRSERGDSLLICAVFTMEVSSPFCGEIQLTKVVA
jgi:hypothetical protein